MTRETADASADWEVVAGAGLELRRFAGARLIAQPSGCVPSSCTTTPDPGGARHVDEFVSGHLDVTRTGAVLVGAGYSLQWNRSNSYAESVVRHVGTVRFTALLPFRLYLAARTELVYATYPDRVTLAIGPSGQPSASIDDENRNQARAELSRDLGAHLQIVGRYTLYTNAFGQVQYGRQTATISLVYAAD